MLSVVDQALSSLTNLLAVVVAARFLGSHGFGEFSVVYGLVVIALGLCQAFVSQELVLLRGSRARTEGAVLSAVHVTLVAGCGLAVPVAVAGLLFSALLPAMLVAALTLPLLLVQDCLRYGSALIGRMGFAVLLDALWLALMVGGSLAVGLLDPKPGVAALLFCWSGSGAVAGLVGVLLIGRLCPQAERDVARYRSRRFLGYRFVTEFAAVRGTNQVLSVSLGAFVSYSAAGALRGMTTLYGPVNVLVQSVASFGAPLFAEVDARRRHRGLALMGAAMLAAGAVATAVLMLLPDAWGRAILGETWEQAQSIVLPLGVQASCVGIVIAANLGLRLIQPRSTLRLQLVATVVFAVLFLGGTAIAGIQGAAWGLGLGTAFQAVLSTATYVWLSRRASRAAHEPVLVG